MNPVDQLMYLQGLFEDEPERASPYSPADRFLLNPLYIHPATCPDFEDNEAVRTILADPVFKQGLENVRQADWVKARCGVSFAPSMLFDIQVKRIHEYKRQLLNILHVIYRYELIRRGETDGMVPPWKPYVPEQTRLKVVMKLLESGNFNLFENDIFQPIINTVLNPNDPWLSAHDFDSFIDAQQEVDLAFRDPSLWTSMSILNTASSAYFSSDRTIREYSEQIWSF